LSLSTRAALPAAIPAGAFLQLRLDGGNSVQRPLKTGLVCE